MKKCHQNIADAFAPAEEDFRHIIIANTWGHLALKKNKTYKMRIVYAMGIYDGGRLNPTILVCDSHGLSDSPWFYEACCDFLDEISWKPTREYPPLKGYNEAGCVYEWVGTFKNYTFSGKTRLLYNPNLVRL